MEGVIKNYLAKLNTKIYNAIGSSITFSYKHHKITIKDTYLLSL